MSIMLTNSYIDYPDVTSSRLTTVAWGVAYGSIGQKFMALAITVFAWTTIIGMYYSCSKSVNYAMGDTALNKKMTPVYMLYFIIPALVFYDLEADLLWAFTDLLSAGYVIVTLVFIYGKRKEIFRLYNDFWDRFLPTIQRGESLKRYLMRPLKNSADQ